ncbi:hypothetical protein D3C86_1522530 [compost metagenome]
MAVKELYEIVMRMEITSRMSILTIFSKIRMLVYMVRSFIQEVHFATALSVYKPVLQLGKMVHTNLLLLQNWVSNWEINLGRQMQAVYGLVLMDPKMMHRM